MRGGGCPFPLSNGAGFDCVDFARSPPVLRRGCCRRDLVVVVSRSGWPIVIETIVETVLDAQLRGGGGGAWATPRIPELVATPDRRTALWQCLREPRRASSGRVASVCGVDQCSSPVPGVLGASSAMWP